LASKCSLLKIRGVSKVATGKPTWRLRNSRIEEANSNHQPAAGSQAGQPLTPTYTGRQTERETWAVGQQAAEIKSRGPRLQRPETERAEQEIKKRLSRR